MRTGRSHRGELRDRPIAVTRLGVTIAVVLAVTACGGGVGTDPGRLVVVDETGVVFTIRPDGTDRTDLGRADADTVLRQPTWSPDGRLVAWVEAGPGGALVHVALGDGGDPRSAPVASSPFYLHWSPEGEHILALGSPPGGGIEASTLGVGATLAVETFDVGQPFYLDWSPDGERVITHVGNARLAIHDADGAIDRVLDAAPAAFQAPAWVGGRIVYAAVGTIRSALVVEDVDAEEAAEVLEFDGSIRFDVAGDRIAYLVTTSGVIEAALLRTPTAAPGALSVLDLSTGEITVALRGRVLAFSWSPNGERLLSLEAAEAGRVRWRVWDGAGSIEFAPFRPTSLDVRSYLPFFDQYARSETAWSPGSDAFAYAAGDGDGRSGIWVQPVAPGSAPWWVAAGDHVGWGP